MGYIDFVDFDKNWWQICSKGEHQEMVQLRISWFTRFHGCEWQSGMEYVDSAWWYYKKKTNNTKWRVYIAEEKLNMVDPLDKNMVALSIWNIL